jgi:A/G-specific adenine glycosylase
LRVVAGKAGSDWAEKEGIWVAPERFSDYALPSVMQKVVRHAFAHA